MIALLLAWKITRLYINATTVHNNTQERGLKQIEL